MPPGQLGTYRPLKKPSCTLSFQPGARGEGQQGSACARPRWLLAKAAVGEAEDLGGAAAQRQGAGARQRGHPHAARHLAASSFSPPGSWGVPGLSGCTAPAAGAAVRGGGGSAARALERHRCGAYRRQQPASEGSGAPGERGEAGPGPLCCCSCCSCCCSACDAGAGWCSVDCAAAAAGASAAARPAQSGKAVHGGRRLAPYLPLLPVVLHSRGAALVRGQLLRGRRGWLRGRGGQRRPTSGGRRGSGPRASHWPSRTHARDRAPTRARGLGGTSGDGTTASERPAARRARSASAAQQHTSPRLGSPVARPAGRRRRRPLPPPGTEAPAPPGFQKPGRKPLKSDITAAGESGGRLSGEIWLAAVGGVTTRGVYSGRRAGGAMRQAGDRRGRRVDHSEPGAVRHAQARVVNAAGARLPSGALEGPTDRPRARARRRRAPVWRLVAGPSRGPGFAVQLGPSSARAGGARAAANSPARPSRASTRVALGRIGTPLVQPTLPATDPPASRPRSGTRSRQP
jgi:hypothetical protein